MCKTRLAVTASQGVILDAFGQKNEKKLMEPPPLHGKLE